jgi:hypothetical protein
MVDEARLNRYFGFRQSVLLVPTLVSPNPVSSGGAVCRFP